MPKYSKMIEIMLLQTIKTIRKRLYDAGLLPPPFFKDEELTDEEKEEIIQIINQHYAEEQNERRN